MGLFNKLKNALFEEEEIELPIKETTGEVKKPVNAVLESSTPKPVEQPKKEVEAILEENERDLFKAENTFKFPDFDEEEFKTNYKVEPKKEEKKVAVTPKESISHPKLDNYGYEKKPKQTRKEIAKKETQAVAPKKAFRPSPVISPVYGVLDKNYKKEDIITVKEEKPKYDVDAIRKKAFGPLEEEIEKSFEAPKNEFYEDNTESIDELLSHSADEQIDIKAEKRSHSRSEKQENEEKISNKRSARKSVEVEESEEMEYQSIEDALEPTVNLEVLDNKPPKSEEQKIEEDTLENDLFDLIDSMYDNREEDDE